MFGKRKLIKRYKEKTAQLYQKLEAAADDGNLKVLARRVSAVEWGRKYLEKHMRDSKIPEKKIRNIDLELFMLIYNCKGWLEYCSMSEEQKDIEDANDMEAYMKTCHTLESIRMLSSAYERVWQAQIPIFGEMPEAGSVEKIEKIYNENIKNNKRKMEEYLAGRRAKSYEC